jgi:hypothetical protein
MNHDTSPIVDFERSERGVFVYGCDRVWAEYQADRIIREGRAEQALKNFSDPAFLENIRKLNVEQREQQIAQGKKIEEEMRALAQPMPISGDKRGGQPGSWFSESESSDDTVYYEQSGAPRNEDMERKVRSAFAK